MVHFKALTVFMLEHPWITQDKFGFRFVSLKISMVLSCILHIQEVLYKNLKQIGQGKLKIQLGCQLRSISLLMTRVILRQYNICINRT